jgi:hypothetical protein
VTHTLHVFVLRDLETGRQLGLGGIAPTARYVSLKFRDVDRIQRRYATASEWPEFEARRAEHFPPTPLESGHVVVQMLLPTDNRAGIKVQYLTEYRVTVAESQELFTRLDAALVQLRLVPKQERTPDPL